jgi:hypothetical protein
MERARAAKDRSRTVSKKRGNVLHSTGSELMPPDQTSIHESKLSGTKSVSWSICIPTFRARESLYLEQTVSSVLEQLDLGDNAEVLVIENPSGADDLTSEMIDHLKSRGITYHKNHTNIGMQGNWNRCLELAKGDLVHILHDDDFVLRGFYGRMQQLAERFPHRGIYFCRCDFVNSKGNTVWTTPELPNLYLDGTSILDFVHYGNPVQCAGAVIRNKKVSSLGGFDDRYPFSSDWEYWIRSIVECHGAAVPDILACYRVHEANATSHARRTCIGEKERIALARHLDCRYGLPDKNGFIGNPAQIAWKRVRACRQAGDIDAAEANEEFFRRCVRQEPILIQLARAVKHFVTAVRDSGAPDRSLKKLWKDYVVEVISDFVRVSVPHH